MAACCSSCSRSVDRATAAWIDVSCDSRLLTWLLSEAASRVRSTYCARLVWLLRRAASI